MRISILKGDPNFVANGKDYIVTINDKKQDSCIIADEDKGLIIRYKKTKLGTMCRARNGKLATEAIYGNVAISIKDSNEAAKTFSEECPVVNKYAARPNTETCEN